MRTLSPRLKFVFYAATFGLTSGWASGLEPNVIEGFGAALVFPPENPSR